MRKMEGSSIDLRAKARYREVVRNEANCTTCVHNWGGVVCHYCEVLSAPHDVGTTANESRTCDLHEPETAEALAGASFPPPWTALA